MMHDLELTALGACIYVISTNPQSSILYDDY